MNWKYRLWQSILGGLDLLFPPRCGGCNQNNTHWCQECIQRIKPIREPSCRVCGHPSNHPGICSTCKRNPPPYKEMRSWLIYEGPIRHALLQLKYLRNITLGDVLARQFFPILDGFHWPIDCVTPVPLGVKKNKERGYNQVGMIALTLSHLGEWEYNPRALVRIRETRSQVGLTVKEREANVLNAFQGDKKKVKGKVVLLIDDIATTGTTLFECSKALREAGAKEIFAYTVARALSSHLKIV